MVKLSKAIKMRRFLTILIETIGVFTQIKGKFHTFGNYNIIGIVLYIESATT